TEYLAKAHAKPYPLRKPMVNNKNLIGDKVTATAPNCQKKEVIKHTPFVPPQDGILISTKSNASLLQDNDNAPSRGG
ncbi:hypothetical protein MKX03_015192, partial [Papaver bracteatum]